MNLLWTHRGLATGNSRLSSPGMGILVADEGLDHWTSQSSLSHWHVLSVQ